MADGATITPNQTSVVSALPTGTKVTPEQAQFLNAQLDQQQQQQPQPQSLPDSTVSTGLKLNPEQAQFLNSELDQQQKQPQENVLTSFSADQLAQLQHEDPKFNIVQAFASNPQLKQDPATVQKVADALAQYEDTVSFREKIPSIKDLASNIFGMAKGYVKTGAVGLPAELISLAPGLENTPLGKIADQLKAEIIAGNTAALQGVAQFGKEAAGTIWRKLPFTDKLSDLSPQERVSHLYNKLADQQVLSDLATGKAPWFGDAFQKRVEQLAIEGYKLRPEDIADYSAGSPLALKAMSSAFGAAGKVTAPVTQPIVSPIVAGAAKLLPKAVGGTLGLAGAAAEKGVGFVEAHPIISSIGGAIFGHQALGEVAGVPGGTLGVLVKPLVEKGVGPAAEAIKKFGAQVAGKVPAEGLSQAAIDALQSLPPALRDLGTGALFDAGIIATAPTPEEAKSAGIGTLFGGLAAAARTGLHITSGQIIAPRDWSSAQPVKANGYFPTLEPLSNQLTSIADAGVRARLNAIRGFLRSVNPNSDALYIPRPEDKNAADPLVDRLKALGFNENNALSFAGMDGFSAKRRIDPANPDAGEHHLIVFRNLDSAPHETAHVMSDVIGSTASNALWDWIKTQYDPKTWDAFTQNYAKRVAQAAPEPAAGQSWQDYLMDVSGWGKARAGELLARRNKFGDENNPGDLSATEVASALSSPEVQDNWRNILGQDGVNLWADRYIGDEVAAENWDAYFKHAGPALREPTGIIPAFGRIVNSVLTHLGIDPLAATRAAEASGLPLSAPIIEALKGTAKGLTASKPAIEPQALKPLKGPIMPGSPEAQQREQDKAQQIAAAAPTSVAPGAARSQQEILGIIAEAIGRGTGVNIDYRSAPEPGPAAATEIPGVAGAVPRGIRREIIERFRNMPEAIRPLISKLFKPIRLRSSQKGIQVEGWAPQVISANAQKFASLLIEHPELQQRFPQYAIDPAKNSFTPEAWKQLLSDVDTYAYNQATGHTGSGETLVFPKDVTKKQYYQPPVTGTPLPLDRAKADIINMLFGIEPQETGKIAKAGVMPQSIAGQKISEATIPGRLGAARAIIGEDVGEKQVSAAKALGLKGAPVREVNPALNELRAGGYVDRDTFIEAIQRLNAEHMADAQHAPEQPTWAGNIMTLRAGFQPPRGPSEGVYGPGPKLTEEEEARLPADYYNVPVPWWKKPIKTEDFLSRNSSFAGDNEMGVILHSGSLRSTRFIKPGEPAQQFLDAVNQAPNQAAKNALIESYFGGASAEAQFNPSDSPRAIRAAAVEGPDGEPYEGKMHFMALQNFLARNPGYDATKLNLLRQGYVTNEGKFLDRDEASTRAQELGQMPVSYAGKPLESGALTTRQKMIEMGYPSDVNFNPRQLVTPEWEKRLKDTKIRFEDGSLKPVFHATTQDFPIKNIRTGGFQAHFGSPDQAAVRVLGPERSEYAFSSEKARLHPVFLDLKKPIRLEDPGSWDDPLVVVKSIQNAGVSLPEKLSYPRIQRTFDAAVARVEDIHEEDAYTQTRKKLLVMLQQALIRKGYDGVVYQNTFERGKPTLSFGGRRKVLVYEGQEDYHPLSDISESFSEGDSYIPFSNSQIHPILEKLPGYQAEGQFKPREIEIEGPDGKKYRARFDGFQDMSMLGRGMVPQITALEDLPGGPVAKSTTYGPSLEEKGYKLPSLEEIQPSKLSSLEERQLKPPVSEEEKIKLYQGTGGAFGAGLGGSWFTTDENRAASFGPQGRTLEIPTSVAEEAQREARVRGSGTKADHFLPDEWVKKAQPIELKPKVHEIQMSPEKGAAEKGDENGPFTFIVRHGSTAMNSPDAAKDKIRGWKDIPLSAEGRKEVDKTANELAQFSPPVTTIYASDLDRTDKTAQVIADKTGAKIISEPGFRPWKFGPTIEGKPTKNMLPVIENLVNNPDERPPEGETFNEFKDRALAAYHKVQNETPNENSAIVTHYRVGKLLEAWRETGVNNDGIDVKNFAAYDPNKKPAGFETLDKRGALVADSGEHKRLLEKQPVTGQFKPPEPPKEEEFRKEDTLAAALHKPNWMVITATQEKLGAGTDEVNQTANENLEKSLIADGYNPIPVKGNYKGVDQGLNYLVTGITPKEALEWGKKYNQESVLVPQGLLYQDNTVVPVKHEETVTGEPAKKQDFYSQIENGPAFSMGLDWGSDRKPISEVQFKPPTKQEFGEQEGLPGISTPRVLSSNEVANLTKKDAAERYPEAVIPKTWDANLEYNLKNTPLYKEAKNENAAVEQHADKLAEFAREHENDPAYKSGKRWYSEFVPMLKATYKKDANTMAQLLAATSPRKSPQPNFALAHDALEGYRAGRYKREVSGYLAGLEMVESGKLKEWYDKKIKEDKVEDPPQNPTVATYLNEWINAYDLRPRQSNGKLFGMHSIPVLQVLAGNWLTENTGPKTQQFVKNLLGLDHGPTIDMWAARTLHRTANEGYKDRWRILPSNETGVSGEDFDYGQKVFTQAAKKLGMKPDELQGALWFAEKELWDSRGWARLDLGDYRKEIKKAPMMEERIAKRLRERGATPIIPSKQKELEQLITPRKTK